MEKRKFVESQGIFAYSSVKIRFYCCCNKKEQKCFYHQTDLPSPSNNSSTNSKACQVLLKKSFFFSSSYQFTTICYYFAIKHFQKQQPSHAVKCRCSTFNIHTRRFVSKNIQTIKNCQRQEIRERNYNERKICETFLHFRTETKTQKRENNQISPIDKTCQL